MGHGREKRRRHIHFRQPAYRPPKECRSKHPRYLQHLRHDSPLPNLHPVQQPRRSSHQPHLHLLHSLTDPGPVLHHRPRRRTHLHPGGSTLHPFLDMDVYPSRQRVSLTHHWRRERRSRDDARRPGRAGICVDAGAELKVPPAAGDQGRTAGHGRRGEGKADWRR